jgi:site-specific recombinase XerD
LQKVFYFCSTFFKSNRTLKNYIVVRAPKGFDGCPARRAHYCQSKNEAKELRLRIKRWKAEQKSPTDTLSFDDNDKRWLAYLRAHIKNLALLPEIVTHWERTAKTITNPLKVDDLCRAFVTYRQTKKLDKRTLAEDRYIARRLRDQLGKKRAHEVTRADIRRLLDSATSESIARKIYKVTSLIFDYGKENGAIAVHPMLDMDRPQIAYAIPGILLCAQFRVLLTTADTKFPDLLPFLTLAGFAGLRRAEMVKQYADDQVLHWSDIDFTKRLITVRDDVAKTTRRKLGNRRFVPMESALCSWLTSYRLDNGPVVRVSDAAFRRQMKKLFAAAELTPEQNALRHSFASYWLARAENGVGVLAKHMGNSESVCRRHYLETLSPDEGKAWFAIRPKKRQRPSSVASSLAAAAA